MTAAFLYLIVCSFKNRIRSRLKRLRQPRYLAGLIVGGLYFYFMLFRPTSRSARGRGLPGPMLQTIGAPMQVLAGAVLFLIVALAWLVPGRRKAVEFTRSEVQFLFTAPVTRRELIHYKLVRGQVAALLSSVIFAILLRPGRLAAGATMMVGIWLAFGLLNLHLTGVALSRASLAEHGASGLRRFGLPALVVIGAALALIGVVVADWRTLDALATGREALDEVARLATTGVGGVILWPFRAVVALPLATSTQAFFLALGPVAGLYALNYLWVVRSDAAFEEASAESAEKRAVNPRAWRPTVKKTVGTPFPLAAEGRVEMAILWKNLILIGRYLSPRLLISLLPMVIVLGVMSSQMGRSGIATAAGSLALGLLAMTILLGPMMARNDLRQDLKNLALLKTWPLSGATIIRGEVLAPAALLSSVAIVFIAAAAAFMSGTLAKGGVSVADQLAYAAVALILAPALILGQTVLQNAIAVVLPAWAVMGASRASGIDAMGQRILLTFGTMLGLVVGLIPAALVAAMAGLGLYWITGRVMLVIPAIVAAGVILAECWAASEALGLVLDRTDVSAVEAQET